MQISDTEGGHFGQKKPPQYFGHEGAATTNIF